MVDTYIPRGRAGNRRRFCQLVGCDMRKKERLRRRFKVVLAAVSSTLGGAGMVSLGPAGAIVLGGLLILALLGLAWAVVFSPRDEPSQRLRELIEAFRRGR